MSFMSIMMPIAMVGGISMMIPPLARSETYALNKLWPNQVLSPMDVLTLRRRERIEEEFKRSELESMGFNDDRQFKLYNLTDQILNITELISAYRRGEFERGELDMRANRAGWSPWDVEKWLKITEVIPSASDIIRYAVREVYTPEIAEAFGQYEELDKVMLEAKDDLKAAGLPPDTFKKEWAAHWMLPSVGQGYEMLHRGVIPARSTPETPLSLERLMVALDIMPAWRNPLTAISYAPFTRVDVRRMHKTGVLDERDVFIAYADVGFSPFAEDHEHDTPTEGYECETCRHESKAGRMTDFTIVYNADPPAEETSLTDREKGIERDLTKTDILAGYKDELLDPQVVHDSLFGLGYSEAEIAYYMSKVDYQKARDETATTIKYIRESYIKHVMDFNQATAELGKLDLPAKRVEQLFREWDLDLPTVKVPKVLKPTKSEFLTFRRERQIDDETLREDLADLGYSERYIDLYLGKKEVSS